MTKKIIPTTFRDYAHLLTLLVFIGIVLSFIFNINFISNNINGIFLFFGGIAFLFIGKAFTIKSWIKDGIQPNEITQILSVIFGGFSIIMGILLFLNVALSDKLSGIIGYVAIYPTLFILIDYITRK